MRLRLFFAGACVVCLSACSTAYEKTALKSWDDLASGRADEAIQRYESDVKSSKDYLLKIMDEGMLLRTAGRFDESNKKFLEAADLIDDNGYLSIGEQAVTLLSNEKQTVYQGEDFEKVLVHVYLALNFISLGDWQSALVETRRVNEILFMFISEAKRPYELNAFARYLGAIIYEKESEINDAYIAYENTMKIDQGLLSRFPVLKVDVLRNAMRMRFEDRVEGYRKQFGEKVYSEAKESLEQKKASLVLLYESGKSPEKYSSRERHSKTQKGGSLVEVLVPVTYYKDRPTQIRRAELHVSGLETRSAVLNDIEATAIQHLKDRMGRAIAKALLTAGVKAGIATGIGMATDSKELGLLAGLALFAASEADTRSWLLLPENLQVARLYLAPGTYSDIEIHFLNEYGTIQTIEKIPPIRLKAFEVKILQRRTFY